MMSMCSMEAPQSDLSRTDILRIVLAMVALPLVAFVVALGAYPLLYARYDHVTVIGFPLPLRIAIAVALAAVPLSIVGAMGAVGLRLLGGSVSRTQALILGVIVGNVPMLVVATLELVARRNRGSHAGMNRGIEAVPLPGIALGSVLGLICALVFWQIARDALRPPHRPWQS
jgi:hypothetical protein